jgi:hypothetical protein
MTKYLAVAVAAAAMIVPATASAQTTVPFQGSVYEKTEGKQNTVTCPIQQYYCGSAYVVGYGPAFWQFNSATPVPTSSDCAKYVGTSTVKLNDGTGVLVLDETEIACQPGTSGTTPNFWTDAFGHPLYSNGNWTVDPASSGVFAGMTGSGTDTLRSDGAILKAAWSGTVTQP